MLAVDATSRPYNIALLPLGGQATVNTVNPGNDHVFVTMHADGGDIYYFFDSATATVDDTAKITAGTAASATSMSAATTACAKLLSGTSIDLRINRRDDKWLVVKTSTSTAILRMYASSQPEI